MINETWRINNVQLEDPLRKHKLEVHCNETPEELVKLPEPVFSDEDLKNYDAEKLRKGMTLEMTSMKNLDV